jgi:hypothetical protein
MLGSQLTFPCPSLQDGLMLFTDDGVLAAGLINPTFGGGPGDKRARSAAAHPIEGYTGSSGGSVDEDNGGNKRPGGAGSDAPLKPPITKVGPRSSHISRVEIAGHSSLYHM